MSYVLLFHCNSSLRQRASALGYMYVLFHTEMTRQSWFRQIGRNIFRSRGWLAASDMDAEMSVITCRQNFRSEHVSERAKVIERF
jgi:hypothetical protein